MRIWGKGHLDPACLASECERKKAETTPLERESAHERERDRERERER